MEHITEFTLRLIDIESLNTLLADDPRMKMLENEDYELTYVLENEEIEDSYKALDELREDIQTLIAVAFDAGKVAGRAEINLEEKKRKRKLPDLFRSYRFYLRQLFR